MRCGYKTGLTFNFLHSVRVKSGPDQVRGNNVDLIWCCERDHVFTRCHQSPVRTQAHQRAQ